MLSDVVIVLPLCLATALGLLRQRRWAPQLLLVTAGAFAFDVLHFGVFTAQARPSALARVAIAAGVMLLLAGVVWVVRAELLERATGEDG